MKDYFIFDDLGISNSSTIDPKIAELGWKKLATRLKKFSYSADVKTYEDAIKNLDNIDINTIQKYNSFLKLSAEQEDSLRLMQEII